MGLVQLLLDQLLNIKTPTVPLGLSGFWLIQQFGSTIA